MNRQHLLDLLRTYAGSDPHEESMRMRIIHFVEQFEDCFERTQLSGHITASALIVNKQRTHTLLTHHHKLEKWLQLGGHSDGDPDPLNVAMREAEEESGLKDVGSGIECHLRCGCPHDPGTENEPEHFHYDIRFLFEADDVQTLSSPKNRRTLHGSRSLRSNGTRPRNRCSA
jgi:hypothetical protein